MAVPNVRNQLDLSVANIVLQRIFVVFLSTEIHQVLRQLKLCVLNVLLIIFVETQNTGTQKIIQLIKVRVEYVLTVISTMY
jgi:hypothetical protein